MIFVYEIMMINYGYLPFSYEKELFVKNRSILTKKQGIIQVVKHDIFLLY